MQYDHHNQATAEEVANELLMQTVDALRQGRSVASLRKEFSEAGVPDDLTEAVLDAAKKCRRTATNWPAVGTLLWGLALLTAGTLITSYSFSRPGRGGVITIGLLFVGAAYTIKGFAGLFRR